MSTPAPLRVGFQVWGQQVTWPELMAAGQAIEALGFDSLFSNDHFYPVVGGPDGPVTGQDGPIFEGWMILAGFVAATERIRLGCLVSGTGYRNPCLLVKMATALDHASGGRLSLGLGAGWHEREHLAFGYGYPTLGERIGRLEEAAAIVRGLLDGEEVTFAGRWYATDRARNDPPPRQARLPLLVGGSGEKRTLRIVARFADAWNGEGDPEMIRHKSAVLDEHCRAVGRDPAAIRRTVGLAPPLIRGSRDAARAALAAILERHGLTAEQAARAADSPLAGTADEVAALLAAYRDAGAEEVIFDWPSPFDSETLERLAEVRRRLAG